MPSLVVKLSQSDIKVLAEQAAKAGFSVENYATALVLDTVRGHPVTVIDVAKAAKVSSMTVSCALNGRDDQVAPGTKQRILAVAKRMGYRPNLAAIAMRKKATEARRAAKSK
jgi:hypothetical protein